MTLLIKRTLAYLTMLALLILGIERIPDVQLSGLVTGGAGVFLLLALAGYGVYLLTNQWLLVAKGGRIVLRAIYIGWQHIKLQSYGDVYAMSFLVAAFGMMVVILGLEGVSTTVSQAAGILVPGAEALMIVAFGAAGMILSALLVVFPDTKMPYYGAVGLILIYAAFSFLNTWQRAVSGRGALATLAIAALAYFAFRTMMQQGVTIKLRKALHNTLVAREADEKLIRRLSEVDIHRVATEPFTE